MYKELSNIDKIRLEFKADNIINSNYLKKYNRKQLNNIINNSDIKLNKFELEYILLIIYKKLLEKK